MSSCQSSDCHSYLKHDMLNFKKIQIQHSKKHVRIFIIMETLVDMIFSIVIMLCSIVLMTSSNYGRDSINKKYFLYILLFIYL